MKRQYSKPNMSVEMFEANEYIANCITVECSKPHPTGVFYHEKNRIPGYQGLWPENNALYACEKNREAGPCGEKIVIKETSLERSDNLYYDSDGVGPIGTVKEAYYFKDGDGYKHHFVNWTPTGTNAS